MGTIERNAAGKIVAKRFTCEQLEAADADCGGFCLACGDDAYGVEPDARKYECESCGLRTVYGAGEIALMGLMA